VGCGGGQQAPAEQATPAEPAAPAVDVAKHMHEHLARVTTMQEAVIRGDIEAAVEPARWIADTRRRPVCRRPGSRAGGHEEAGRGRGRSQRSQERRHGHGHGDLVLRHVPRGRQDHRGHPEAPKPVAEAGVSAHMMEHQWATDLLYQGLVMPSEERWQKGLTAMEGTPLSEKDLPKDAALTKEIVALEKRVHEMAGKAKTATDLGTKVAFYGEYIGAAPAATRCTARCGPGLPK